MPDISKWDVKSVTNMEALFSKCFSLQRLPDIGKWEIRNDVKKGYMFKGCRQNLNIPKKFIS